MGRQGGEAGWGGRVGRQGPQMLKTECEYYDWLTQQLENTHFDMPGVLM